MSRMAPRPARNDGARARALVHEGLRHPAAHGKAAGDARGEIRAAIARNSGFASKR